MQGCPPLPDLSAVQQDPTASDGAGVTLPPLCSILGLVPGKGQIDLPCDEVAPANAGLQTEKPPRPENASRARASLLLPTTFTSDVWRRLPTSSQELMQEALSLLDFEREQEQIYVQQHGLEAEPGPAAQGEGAPHATVQYKLDEEKVVNIFLAKRDAPEDRYLSARLAAQYGVTPKAVRDIWNRRTWTSITLTL